MGQIDKLLRKLNSGGLLTFAELQTLLRAYGFRLDRIAGSHHIYVNHAADRPLSVQPDGKDAKRYQVRQLRDMIAEFGLEPHDQ